MSKGCKLTGDHRDTFYEVQRALRMGPRNPHQNRVVPDIDQRIPNYSLQHPTQGPQ